MADADLSKRLVKILTELEERFQQGTIPLKEMTAYVETQKIPNLAGYLRRAGAVDYQSPKRFYQAGPYLKQVRDALKKNKVPRGLEGLLESAA